MKSGDYCTVKGKTETFEFMCAGAKKGEVSLLKNPDGEPHEREYVHVKEADCTVIEKPKAE
jgi:hypothetical protein